ncbi:hypothetical protein C8J56DRAFT_1046371 [Mycena floridula]|nr:hypothetical protein C8J56DRAFT_1046371 [Mycena floridula]
MAPVFPQEIFNLIIAQFAKDREALFSCSLVCHDWTVETRSYLFRSMTFSRDRNASDVFFASVSPEILARNIRTLNIMDSIIRRRDDDFIKKLLEKLEPSFVFLQSLTRLQLVFIDFSSLSLDSISNFPSLTTLSMTGCHFQDLSQLMKLVCSYPTLETLSLRDISWKAQRNDYKPANAPHMLRHLVLCGHESQDPTIYGEIFRWIFESNICLQTFRIQYPTPDSHDPVQNLISAAGSGLLSLTIEPSTMLFVDLQALDLSQNTGLETLRFRNTVYRGNSSQHIIDTISSVDSPALRWILLPKIATWAREEGSSVFAPFLELDSVLERHPVPSGCRVELAEEMDLVSFPLSVKKGLIVVK